jgi:hypothetical protein
VLLLCCCDKIPNINNLRIYFFAHGFRDFSPFRCIDCGLLVRQNIMVGLVEWLRRKSTCLEHHGGRNMQQRLLTSWQTGSEERKGIQDQV